MHCRRLACSASVLLTANKDQGLCTLCPYCNGRNRTSTRKDPAAASHPATQDWEPAEMIEVNKATLKSANDTAPTTHPAEAALKPRILQTQRRPQETWRQTLFEKNTHAAEVQQGDRQGLAVLRRDLRLQQRHSVPHQTQVLP